jgi:hypothetical protein
MDVLSNVSRFVLFAVRNSKHDLSVGAVGRLTGLPLVTVTKAIKQLESQKLVQAVEQYGETCYLPIGLAQSPFIAGYQSWLEDYCSRPARCEEGDTEAMTFGCCGIVILSAVLSGSRNPQFLTRLTSLPGGFVRLVLAMMDRPGLWWSDRAFDLEHTIQQHSSVFTEVDDSLHSVTEEFWGAWRSPNLGKALDTLRAGQQYGGLQDRWLEADDTRVGPFLVL